MGVGKGIMEKEWAIYRDVVVPADASPEQVEFIQQTFYGGAMRMAAVLAEMAEEENSIDLLATLSKELSDFASEVVRKANAELAELGVKVKHGPGCKCGGRASSHPKGGH